MGIRKVFQKKDPTEDQILGDMEKDGIITKSKFGGAREEKFGAFKAYAEERATRKPGFAPVNPYANLGNTNGNPYAPGNEAPAAGAGPTGAPGAPPQNNPYGARSAPDSDPRRSSRSRQPEADPNNPYANPTRSSRAPPPPLGALAARASPYAQRAPKPSLSSRESSRPSINPYGGSTSRQSSRTAVPSLSSASIRTAATSRTTAGGDDELLDLNLVPTNSMFEGHTPARRYEGPQGSDEPDLNDLPEEEDLNLDIQDEMYDEDAQVNSEDEEIEAIKQEIRFTKQESLASTRNTLRMAQEADAAAINTMGILGSQSERLYNSEQNMLLAGTQTKLAEDKVSELHRLNRLIFIPAYGNPFNKKLRLRRQEEEIKAAKAQEKYMRENNRLEMYASEMRLKTGITNNATNGEVYQKYVLEKALQEAQRYQFENDLEDDEIEKELAQNLEQIGLYAKKLKTLAQTMGAEVDAQNARLQKIEEDADRLDLNVHMNTARLANIR